MNSDVTICDGGLEARCVDWMSSLNERTAGMANGFAMPCGSGDTVLSVRLYIYTSLIQGWFS